MADTDESCEKINADLFGGLEKKYYICVLKV
jgi:hypothetical protein